MGSAIALPIILPYFQPALTEAILSLFNKK